MFNSVLCFLINLCQVFELGEKGLIYFFLFFGIYLIVLKYSGSDNRGKGYLEIVSRDFVIWG